MSVERVRAYFKEFGLEDKVVELSDSSTTVELAAKALGCAPERIAKTIACKLSDKAILIVAAGDTKIDNKKYRNTFGEKAKMLSFEEVEPTIGYPVGGVCPFAVNAGVVIYLDESLKRFDYVFPAAGSGNSAIKMTIPELELYSRFTSWIDVCKINDNPI